MSDFNKLPKRRFTASRERYWREYFNDLASMQSEHEISGWSVQGLHLRIAAYLQVLSEFSLEPGALVLDLGCGAGAYTRILGESGFRVLGVDYAWRVTSEGRKRTTSGNVEFLSGDASNLPFADGIFDHVVCVGLFQSLQRYRHAMAEICRVLKPGGVLCLMTLNQRNLKVRLERWFGREEIIVVDGRPQPRLITYDPALFARELADTGMLPLSTQPVQIYPEGVQVIRWLMRCWNRLPLLNYWTARDFMVIARNHRQSGATTAN